MLFAIKLGIQYQNIVINKCSRGIAQLVEHRSPKPSVVSSNLTAPAKNKTAFMAVFLWHSGPLMRTHEKVVRPQAKGRRKYAGELCE